MKFGDKEHLKWLKEHGKKLYVCNASEGCKAKFCKYKEAHTLESAPIKTNCLHTEQRVIDIEI